MNIHEHQAKNILRKYGAKVPDGVYALDVNELLEKAKNLKTDKYVLKAQIHAGGRGKAGGVKIVNDLKSLETEAKSLLGKKLITHQTGPSGRIVKRLYVEVSSNIDKEFYLSCVVDRASSKIAFISSDQGGMDIEEVAIKSPEKILTTKVDLDNEISEENCNKIIIEASSIGLEQNRLYPIKFDKVAFSNLSRDHLDYHKNFLNYKKAKSILFIQHIKPNSIAVLNTDDKYSNFFFEICKKKKLKILDFGKNGKFLKFFSLKKKR